MVLQAIISGLSPGDSTRFSICGIIESMKTKRCSKCKQVLFTSDFNKAPHKLGGLQSICKKCNKIYQREHYKNNKEYYHQRNIKRRKELKQLLFDIKRKSKCNVCRENHPACLDFHHKNPDKKKISISLIPSRFWSDERTLKEIEKCVILCANCHRKAHHQEKLGY